MHFQFQNHVLYQDYIFLSVEKTEEKLVKINDMDRSV